MQQEATSETPVVRTRYTPKLPVSLRATLAVLRRGSNDPAFHTDASATWRTQRTPHGPVTLRLSRSGAAIDAIAWGPGAEWTIAGVPELLGEGDDWDDLDVSANPFLADSLHRNPGLRLPRSRLVYESMVPAVLEQKVTSVEARRSWRYLLLRFGEAAPGPAPAGMRVFPAAEVWRRIPSWEWHRAGVGPQRSDTVMRVTSVASSLERTLELGRGGREVERRLCSILGVGVWTAAETMQRAHGDPDSPSVGDYHLPALVGLALIGKPVDDDGMLELLAPWAGHRQRIMRLIAASGFTKPRIAPRAPLRDYRAF